MTISQLTEKLKITQYRRRARTVLIGFTMALFVSACGGGSAEEPAFSGPRVVAGSVAVSSSTGTVSNTPDKIGVSTPASTTAVTTQTDAPGAGQCDLDLLNATRFLSSGLVATGIDDSTQCGFCPSAEVCTTPDGVCHCIVVNVAG